MLTTNPDGFFDAYLNEQYEGAERGMYREQARVLSAMRITQHIHAVFSCTPERDVPDPCLGDDYLHFHIYPVAGTAPEWYDWLMRTADLLDDLGAAPEYSTPQGSMSLEWTYDDMHIEVTVWSPSPTCKAVTKTVVKDVTEWVCEG